MLSDCETKMGDDDKDSEHDDMSDSSCNATEDEDEIRIQLGPKMSIREHFEKDKVGVC